MPKPEIAPRPPLYQVCVKDRKTNRVIPVFPKMASEYAEMLRLAVAGQIALGAERRWADPHVVMVTE